MKTLLLLCLSVGPVWATPALNVEVQSAQFHRGQEAVGFKVHGPADSRLQIAILDASDRTVAAPFPGSDGVLRWDGRDGAGRLVNPGTYYVQVVEEPYLWSGAVLVLP